MAVNILIVFGSYPVKINQVSLISKEILFLLKQDTAFVPKFWTLINLFTCIFGQNIDKGLKSDR